MAINKQIEDNYESLSTHTRSHIESIQCKYVIFETSEGSFSVCVLVFQSNLTLRVSYIYNVQN